jgi:hypothetical protein
MGAFCCSFTLRALNVNKWCKSKTKPVGTILANGIMALPCFSKIQWNKIVAVGWEGLWTFYHRPSSNFSASYGCIVCGLGLQGNASCLRAEVSLSSQWEYTVRLMAWMRHEVAREWLVVLIVCIGVERTALRYDTNNIAARFIINNNSWDNCFGEPMDLKLLFWVAGLSQRYQCVVKVSSIFLAC